MDDKIAYESCAIIECLGSKDFTDAVTAVDLLSKLDVAASGVVTPSSKDEIEVCEQLVTRNILNKAFQDPKSYTWHRPIIAHAFKESRMYLCSILQIS